MSNLRGNKKTNRQRSPKTLKNSRRISVIAILALVTLCSGLIFILLNFSLSGDNEINPSTAHSAKKSSSGDQKGQIALRSPISKKEASQAKTAFRLRGSNEKSKTDERKIRQPGQKSSNAQPDGQPDTRPYGQLGDQAGIQTGFIPNDKIEDEQNEESEDDPQEFSISGWVFTQAGEPVSRIQLTAIARQLFQSNSDGEPAWTEREQRTQTDSDGFFEFRQLADGEYEVHTQATERYSSTRAVLRAGITSATLIVKEEEEHEVYVYGIVDSTSGRRLAGVRVLPIGQKQATTTDNTGNYGLYLDVSGSRQSYTFRFMHEGYRDQHLTLGETDVREVEDVRLDVSMDPIETLAAVTGTVMGSDGSPVAWASIQLLSAGLKRRYQAGSNLAGDFLIPEVEVASDYRLWVRPKDRYRDYIESGLNVTADGLNLAIVLEPQGLSSLKGQMVDINGKPVPRFSLWLRSALATMPPTLLVTGDELGYFFVDKLPAGKLSLQTNSIPYINISGIELAPGVEEYVQLALDWGNYMMAGFVLNREGDPVPEAQVSLSWLHNANGVSSQARRITVVDAAGYFLFNQLGPGPHTLNINAPGFYSARLYHDVGAPEAEIMVQLEAVTQ
jgi:hypothetical protein